MAEHTKSLKPPLERSDAAEGPYVSVRLLSQPTLECAVSKQDGYNQIARVFTAGFSDYSSVETSTEQLKTQKDQCTRVFRPEGDIEVGFRTILPPVMPDGVVIIDNTYPISEPRWDARVNCSLKGVPHAFRLNFIKFLSVPSAHLE